MKEEKEDNDIVLLACKNNDGDQDYTWYLDTGANNHMCRRRSMFVELNESMNGNVSFGDKSKIPVKGKGNILIPLKKWRSPINFKCLLCAQYEKQHFELGSTLRKRL